jgi:YgiT-type zinc finger domain-containing protein
MKDVRPSKEREMKDVKPSSVCPLCGGTKTPGKTTFTADLGFGVVVIRDVPATVCSQCGADWIADSTAEEVEALVEEARQKHRQVEIISLATNNTTIGNTTIEDKTL